MHIMGIYRRRLSMWIINITALGLFGGLLGWSLTGTEAMRKLFAYGSYYLILLMVLTWAVTGLVLLKQLAFSPRTFIRKYWPGILAAVLLTAAVFCSVRVRFKTLSDETNLLAVSQSMARDKTCFNSTMAKYYYNNLHPFNHEIPKRPLVFPFMVSILHTICGFRHQNAFAMNFIVMFLFLAGLYAAVRRTSDAGTAVAAMLLVIACPVFTVFGTSGGFDIMNTAFFAVVMAAVFCFLKHPSPASLAFVIASCLVCGNVRYESIMFVGLVPLLLCRKIKWPHIKGSCLVICLAPLVSLPYIWQRILRNDAYQNPEGTAVFSISALAENLRTFFTNLIKFDYYLPYAGLLSAAGILIFAWLAVHVIRKRTGFEPYQRNFMTVLAASLGISTFLYFSHFFGVYTHPSSARFFITLSVALALSPVAMRILKPDILSGRTVLIIAAVCFCFYHPIAVEGRFINALMGNRRTEHGMMILKRLNDRNIMVVSTHPGQFTAMGYGAVNFAWANANKDQLLKEARRRLFSKMVVFQEVSYETGRPTPETALPDNWRLKTIYSIQFSATEYLRASVLVVPRAEPEE